MEVEMSFAVTELLVTILAAVSALSSSFVIITGLVFHSMRKRMFMRLIMLISLCDTFGSAAVAFGFPPNHSPLCSAQSFLVNFFYKSSWMWSTILSYQLSGVFMSGKIVLSEATMHLIAWSVPLVSTLIPLSTNSYGRSSQNPDGWCFLDVNKLHDSTFFWVLFSFFLVLFMCISLMSYFTTRIAIKYRQFVRLDLENQEIRMVVDAVQLYPIAMIVCWLPNLVLSLLLNFGLIYDENLLIFIVTQAISVQNGTMTTMLFFYKSREARHRWAAVFRQALGYEDTSNLVMIPLDFPDDDIYSDASSRSGHSSVGHVNISPHVSSVTSVNSLSSTKTIDRTPAPLGFHSSEQRSPLREPLFLATIGPGSRLSSSDGSSITVSDDAESDLFRVSLSRKPRVK